MIAQAKASNEWSRHFRHSAQQRWDYPRQRDAAHLRSARAKLCDKKSTEKAFHKNNRSDMNYGLLPSKRFVFDLNGDMVDIKVSLQNKSGLP